MKIRYLKYISFVLLLLVKGVVGFGQSYTSIASGAWNDPAIWSLPWVGAPVPPGNTQTVVISPSHTVTGATGSSFVLNVSGTLTFSGDYNNGGGGLTVADGGTLIINGNLTTGDITINGTGSLLVTGSINHAGGAITLNGGTLITQGNLTTSSNITIDGTAKMKVMGSITQTGGIVTLNNSGILVVGQNYSQGSQTVYVNNTSTLLVVGNYLVIENLNIGSSADVYVNGTAGAGCTSCSGTIPTSEPAWIFYEGSASGWEDHLLNKGEEAGPISVCPSATSNFSVLAVDDGNLAANTFEWAVYGGTITGADNTSTVNGHSASVKTITGGVVGGKSSISVVWETAAFAGAYVAVRQTSAAGCSDGQWSIFYIHIEEQQTISSQSTDGQTKCIGGTFTPITVTASGTGLGYQWFSNTNANNSGGTNLGSANGAQTNSYTPQATSAGTLYYYCVVTGTCGTVPSAVSGAFVVNEIIISDNVPTSICQWELVSITATASGGTGSYTYSWTDTAGGPFFPGNVLTQSGPSIFITTYDVATGTYTNNFSLTVTDAAGCSTTKQYSVTVNPNVSDNWVAKTNTVCAGQTGVVYTVENLANTTYNWTVTGGAIASGAGTYSITVNWGTGASGNVTVTTLTNATCTNELSQSVTIKPALEITEQSTAAQTQCLNGTFTSISVTATGSGTLTYQWYSNTAASNSGGEIITGATSSSYTPQATSAGTLYYYCVVTGTCGTVPSAVSGAFTVEATTVGGSISGSATVCAGTNSTTLTLSGHTGSVIKWQSSTTSDFSSSVNDITNTSNSYTVTNISATTYYRAVVQNGSCAIENSGNASVIIDMTPPVFTSFPEDVTVSCFGNVPPFDYSQMAYSDNCGAVTLVSLTKSDNGGAGTTANPLIITRTVTIKDDQNNQVSRSQTITIAEDSNLSITCPSDITANVNEGECVATVNYTKPEGAASCEGLSIGPVTNGFEFPARELDRDLNCWQFSATSISAENKITGNYSVITGQLSNPLNPATLTTPFLYLDGTTSISFTYKVQNTSSLPVMGIYLIDTNNQVAQTISSGNVATVSVQTFSGIITQPGIYRIRISFSGSGGNSKANLDDLAIDANYATSYNNCGNLNQFETKQTDVSGLTSGSNFPVGTTVQTYTVIDTRGNTSSCSFNVIVTDNGAPAFSNCPSNITQNVDAGLCAAYITWTLPTVSDNCGGIPDTIRSHSNGVTWDGDNHAMVSVGTSTVTYRATDDAGNFAECTFTVTVTDNIQPTINCPDDVVVSGFAAIPAKMTRNDFTLANLYDNCSINDTSLVVTDVYSGSCYAGQPLTILRTYQISDNATPANTASCTQTITVNDISIEITSVDLSGCAKNNASITSVVSGFSSPIFQWEKSTDSGSNWSIVGTNSSSLGVSSPVINDKYRLKVSTGAANQECYSNILTVVADTFKPSFPVTPSKYTGGVVVCDKTGPTIISNLISNLDAVDNCTEIADLRTTYTITPPSGPVVSGTNANVSEINAYPFPLGTSTVVMDIVDETGNRSAELTFQVKIGSPFSLTDITTDGPSATSGSGYKPDQTSTHTYTAASTDPDDDNGFSFTWKVFKETTSGVFTTDITSSLIPAPQTTPTQAITWGAASVPGNYRISVTKINSLTGCSIEKLLSVTVLVNNFNVKVEDSGNDCQSGEMGTTNIWWDLTQTGGSSNWQYKYEIIEDIGGVLTTVVPLTNSIPSSVTPVTISYNANNTVGIQKTYTLKISSVFDEFGTPETNLSDNQDSLILFGVPNTSAISTD